MKTVSFILSIYLFTKQKQLLTFLLIPYMSMNEKPNNY